MLTSIMEDSDYRNRKAKSQETLAIVFKSFRALKPGLQGKASAFLTAFRTKAAQGEANS